MATPRRKSPSVAAPAAIPAPAAPTPAVSASGRSKFSVLDASRARLIVRASYDNARSTDENAKLWQYVDSLSAAAANDPTVRKTIRERARYEIGNNSYASGIVDTLTNDTIGPAVQLQLGGGDLAQKVEKDFERWARAICLWQKLRTMRRAKISDGEAFAMMITNPKVSDPVKLDIRLIECDQIESWYTNIDKEDEIDGIRFDAIGNPISYRLLKSHPGDYRGIINTGAGDWIARKFMVHYFRPARPGQVRGVSEILPALALFGQLRKYTVAVIETATRAAEISGVMQTNLLPDSVAAELADPVTIMEIERNAIMSLPEGWTLAQLKSEQPTTTYAMFKSEIINEMARCVNMPYNIAACNSSGYNYASGRLDHQTYDRSIDIERSDLSVMVLDRFFDAYLTEYAARFSLSQEDRNELMAAKEWLFASRNHVDPNKEASADDMRFKNGSLTKAAYYAKQAKDWKRESRQYIREQVELEIEWNKAREEAGLPPAPFPGAIPAPYVQTPAKPPEETVEDEPGDGEKPDEE